MGTFATGHHLRRRRRHLRLHAELYRQCSYLLHHASTLFFDGSAYNLSANDVDAINLPLGIAYSPRSNLAYTLPRPGGLRSVPEAERSGRQGGGHFASYRLDPPQQSGSVTFAPVADA